jgi:hypothetical protein
MQCSNISKGVDQRAEVSTPHSNMVVTKNPADQKPTNIHIPVRNKFVLLDRLTAKILL